MNTKKLIIGGIVGGVVYFLLGWLFYGNLFLQYFHDHPGTATGVDKPMDQFLWWALILGNVLAGFLLAYIFLKSGVSTLSSGLITGGILGLLMSSSYDLMMYATTNIVSKHIVFADVAIYTVMSAITGAVIAVVMGMSNRSAANDTVV
ncbi:MAG: hypothetical protein M3004_04185 [Bacteroidota bacterium]|nr:hypothetical protein [Bacteroidota bacterium]